MVTHSERFLRECVNKLVVFDGGKVTTFDGSYQEFIEKIGWAEEEAITPKPSKKNTNKNKQQRELKKEIAKLERKIEWSEKEVQDKTTELIEITKDGYGKAAQELAEEIETLKSEVAEQYDALESKYLELEA